MRLLITRFKEHCIKNNIQLLRDDVRFIEERLRAIDYNLHKDVLNCYYKKWWQGIREEENALRKQNLGRLTANKWLNEYRN